jgi:hypothetical protein
MTRFVFFYLVRNFIYVNKYQHYETKQALNSISVLFMVCVMHARSADSSANDPSLLEKENMKSSHGKIAMFRQVSTVRYRFDHSEVDRYRNM